MPHKVLGLADAAVLGRVDRVRRRRVDHRNHANRNAVIGARQYKRARVRKADLCRAGADLADSIR